MCCRHNSWYAIFDCIDERLGFYKKYECLYEHEQKQTRGPRANNIATNLVAIYWQSESYIPKFTDFSFWSIFVLICFLPQLRQLPISASNFFSFGNFDIKKVHRVAVWPGSSWQEPPIFWLFQNYPCLGLNKLVNVDWWLQITVQWLLLQLTRTNLKLNY